MSLTGLISHGGSALIDAAGRWLVVGSPNTYRFLEDHVVGRNYIQASDIASEGDILPVSWVPTVNVEPLNLGATQAYYDAGPGLGGVIRTQWTQLPVPRPATYWYEVSPNMWALTGLGSNQSLYPPVYAIRTRYE